MKRNLNLKNVTHATQIYKFILTKAYRIESSVACEKRSFFFYLIFLTFQEII